MTADGAAPVIDQFLSANGLSVDEGYDLIVARTSECRLHGYYPDYFYESKVPFMNSELNIDMRRPAQKRRFSVESQPTEDVEKASARYSSNMLREWNSYNTQPLKPKKQRIKDDHETKRSMQGYLLKKTVAYGGSFVRWEKRFVVLTDECLKYTKSKDVNSPDAKWRVYPFTTSANQCCRIGADRVTLIIDGTVFGYARIFELKSTTINDAALWRDKLNAAVQNHN